MFAYTKLMQAMAAAGVVSATDPYFNLTTLLLPGNGTNGAQNNTFLDSSTNNFSITRNGNTTQGTFSPFSQTGWSNYFNGSSTISAASNSAFNILAYDTFECWVNMSVLGTSDLIAGRDAAYWLGYNHTGIGGTANKFVFAIYNGSSWQAVSSSTTPVVGTWYHIMGVKDDTTLRFYVNGVQENTTTFSGSAATGSTVYIASNNNTENLEGYVSNLRLITGASNTVFPYSGLTTGASFTPPTSALTAVSGTAFLTCQSNRFVDNSSNAFALTITSIPSVQAFSPFAPTTAYSAATNGGSGYFDGSGDYLSASGANAALGAGTFTIDGWFYTTGYNTGEAIYSGLNTYPSSTGLLFYINGSGTYVVDVNGSNVISAGTAPLNAWTHFALVRSGTGTNQTTLYINGVSVATGTSATNFTSTYAVIGRTGFGAASNYFLGYLSGVRAVVGSANAPSGVPTAPPTAITNTQLLLNFTNGGIIDATAKNDLETVGNAQISTTQSKWGGSSMYFDGTGDYLPIPAGYNLGFGTGDFTIEGWLYLNATSSYSTIISNRPNGSDTTTGRWSVAVRSSAFEFYANGSQIVSAGTVSTSTWTHFAVCRASGSIRLYLAGTQVGSTTSFTTDLSSLAAWIGANGAGTEAINAYIDDLRVSKYARYTGSTLTVPTEAFPLQ